MRPKSHETPEQKFWRHVSKGSKSECWRWAGGLTYKGYGQFMLGRKQVRAHRFSYEMHVGPIPHGMFVCHHCDRPECVNPAHLFLGSNLENTADRTRKGRTAIIRGENHWRSKVTAAAVIDMRTKSKTLADYSAQYGLTKESVRSIQRRKSWRHI